jgi:hypothetical protein
MRVVDSLINVELGCSLSESLSRAFRKGRILFFLLCCTSIVISWLLGLLCRVGCRHLHVPQNSRQP